MLIMLAMMAKASWPTKFNAVNSSVSHRERERESEEKCDVNLPIKKFPSHLEFIESYEFSTFLHQVHLYCGF